MQALDSTGHPAWLRSADRSVSTLAGRGVSAPKPRVSRFPRRPREPDEGWNDARRPIVAFAPAHMVRQEATRLFASLPSVNDLAAATPGEFALVIQIRNVSSCKLRLVTNSRNRPANRTRPTIEHSAKVGCLAELPDRIHHRQRTGTALECRYGHPTSREIA